MVTGDDSVNCFLNMNCFFEIQQVATKLKSFDRDQKNR